MAATISTMTVFCQIVEPQPLKIRSAIEIADRLFGWHMLDDAAGVLEKCLEEHPAHPILLQRLGRIRLAQGRPDEAAPLLEQSLAHQKLMSETIA